MDLQHTGTDAAFARFTATLDADGLRPALRDLLGLTDYRFIAIYRFRNGLANAAVHVDRDNPEVLQAQEVPASATYCCFARDARGVFSTANSMTDPRLSNHVAREVVRAYCGVPVLTPEGEILGTLCHYDLVPRDSEQIDLPLMLQVCSLLAQRELVPPYPESAD
ncbi:MAG: GAF domain-containing protein [Rubrivivax sp.]